MANKYKTVNRRALGKRIVRAWQLYLIIAVPLIWLIIFHYVPMFGIQIAFKKYTIKGGIWGSKWVGLQYFQKFLKDPKFLPTLINTLRVSIYSLAAGTTIPIILALALNCLRSNKLKKTVQTLTYLPHFISVVVLVGIVNTMFNPIVGVYGNVMTALTGSRPANILGIPTAFPHIYVWSGIWQNMGYSSIIYIAALSGVSNELHEAAQIDGASRLQRVWHVDLPAILPTVFTMLILNSGRIMNVGFEKVYLLQNELNMSYSEVISTYVYRKAFGTGSDFSYSTAIGLFNSVVNLILITSVNYISKKLNDTGLF